MSEQSKLRDMLGITEPENAKAVEIIKDIKETISQYEDGLITELEAVVKIFCKADSLTL